MTWRSKRSPYASSGDVALVELDMGQALITRARARDVYGVCFNEDGTVDTDATQSARTAIAAMAGSVHAPV